MATVFLLHWNQSEAEALAVPLRKAGHSLSIHWSTETGPNLRDALPEIAVISLDRLPSHGRAVAEWLWEAKKRQHIPIVFVGGAPDKVDATRVKFPRASFCSTTEMLGRIGNALAQGLDPAGDKRESSLRAKTKTRQRSNKALQPPSRARKKAKMKGRSRAARG